MPRTVLTFIKAPPLGVATLQNYWLCACKSGCAAIPLAVQVSLEST